MSSEAITFPTVADFIAQADREAFVGETGFAQQSVSRAIAENLMPASWYRDVRNFCAARDLPVPEHLFRWIDKRKSPDKPREAAQ